MDIAERRQGGFTLLEILLVVAAIGILAGIVVLAINPSKQIGETNNAQRRTDVSTILNGVYQYSIGNNGSMPSSIATSATCASPATNEICKSDAVSCTGLVDLSVLTTNEEYIPGMPTDPTAETTNGSGYFIAMSSNDRITVCAPGAEVGANISVTR